MRGILFAALLAGPVFVANAADNPLLDELVAGGVSVNDATHWPLPSPTLPDGLDASAQRQCLAKLADASHPLDALLRRSVVAPFILKISDVDPNESGAARGRRVDLWFVAFGDVQQIADRDFLQRQVAGRGSNDSGDRWQERTLSTNSLQRRGIAWEPSRESQEAYSYLTFDLLEKVRIHGVCRSVESRTPDSVTVASILDPRFAADPEYPNQWLPWRRSTAGTLELGQPAPYAGLGWYAKATRLIEPAGAVLVEFHLAFDEPTAWFNGANLLRSKLPIVVQDNVRTLRRKLDDGTKKP